MSEDRDFDLNCLEVLGGAAYSVSGEPIPPDEIADIPAAPPDTRLTAHLVEVTFSPKLSLERFIYEADAIVGCVAWLTDEDVLTALSKKEAVSLVVQKEDFLRPDGTSRNGWKARLRRLYDNIPATFERTDETFGDTEIFERSLCSDISIESVRCCGVAKEGDRARPNMHHKFFVGLRRSASLDSPGGRPLYYAESVFTGSFNPTKNGAKSLENAVIIRGGIDVHRPGSPSFLTEAGKVEWEELHTACAPHAYLREWGHVMALSEPLDWTRKWIAPQWRLGT